MKPCWRSLTVDFVIGPLYCGFGAGVGRSALHTKPADRILQHQNHNHTYVIT